MASELVEETSRGKIGVSLSMKKNLGNYESVDVGAWVSDAVEDVHSQDAWDKLWAEAEKQLDNQLKDLD